MRIAVAIGATCIVGAACVIAVDGVAGKTCNSASDCPHPLVCIAAREGGVQTCEALALPEEGEVRRDAGVVFWCTGAEPLLVTYCSECHGANPVATGGPPFRLDRYEDDPGGAYEGAKSKADRVNFRAVVWQDMPPLGSPRPSGDERAVIGAWVAGGAPFCADAGP